MVLRADPEAPLTPWQYEKQARCSLSFSIAGVGGVGGQGAPYQVKTITSEKPPNLFPIEGERKSVGETEEERESVIFILPMPNADGDSSHEIKRLLLLGRKAMTNLDSILKSRHITLLTKVRLVHLRFFQESVWT